MDETYQTDELSEETKTHLYDRAMDIGGIRDKPLKKFIEDVVAEMRENHEQEYDVDDETLRQAALEAAAEATQVMADEGYHRHL
jgi:hypothetical protein